MYYSGGFADDARHATISALAGDRVGRDFLATKNVKLARAFGRKICCVHRLATLAGKPELWWLYTVPFIKVGCSVLATRPKDPVEL